MPLYIVSYILLPVNHFFKNLFYTFRYILYPGSQVGINVDVRNTTFANMWL